MKRKKFLTPTLLKLLFLFPCWVVIYLTSTYLLSFCEPIEPEGMLCKLLFKIPNFIYISPYAITLITVIFAYLCACAIVYFLKKSEPQSQGKKK